MEREDDHWKEYRAEQHREANKITAEEAGQHRDTPFEAKYREMIDKATTEEELKKIIENIDKAIAGQQAKIQALSNKQGRAENLEEKRDSIKRSFFARLDETEQARKKLMEKELFLQKQTRK